MTSTVTKTILSAALGAAIFAGAGRFLWCS